MAHYVLQKLHILPSTFNECNKEEKAFIYASVLLRVEDEKAESARINKK